MPTPEITPAQLFVTLLYWLRDEKEDHLDECLDVAKRLGVKIIRSEITRVHFALLSLGVLRRSVIGKVCNLFASRDQWLVRLKQSNGKPVRAHDRLESMFGPDRFKIGKTYDLRLLTAELQRKVSCELIPGELCRQDQELRFEIATLQIELQRLYAELRKITDELSQYPPRS